MTRLAGKTISFPFVRTFDLGVEAGKMVVDLVLGEF